MSAREPRKLRVGELTIEIPDESAQPIYANLVIVNHSPDDFLIDFCFAQPGLPQAQVRSRVAISPGHFKRLVGALQQNLRRYEETFGPIPDRVPPKPGGGVNEGGPQTIN